MSHRIIKCLHKKTEYPPLLEHSYKKRTLDGNVKFYLALSFYPSVAVLVIERQGHANIKFSLQLLMILNKKYYGGYNKGWVWGNFFSLSLINFYSCLIWKWRVYKVWFGLLPIYLSLVMDNLRAPYLYVYKGERAKSKCSGKFYINLYCLCYIRRKLCYPVKGGLD